MKKPTLNRIVKIAAGAAHFLALKKVYRPPFSEWTPQMVEQWVKDIDFDSIANVIKFGRITGAMMEVADFKFV